jgi:hypothetical protein
MPLTKSKSDKAFKHNLKAELAAGKPQKQALAIAYSVKRKAKKAGGGRFEDNDIEMDTPDDYPRRKPATLHSASYYDSDEDYYAARKAHGLPRRPERPKYTPKEEPVKKAHGGKVKKHANW